MTPPNDPGARGRRTPLIAGNWKMHKTVAEAEEFIAALLPAGVLGRRRRRRDLPHVHRAGGDGGLHSRLPGGGLRPEHAPGRSRRLHRRGFGGDAHRARRPGRGPRPLRAPSSTSARPTRRWPRRSRPRSPPGCCPCCASARPRTSASAATPSASSATRSRRIWPGSRPSGWATWSSPTSRSGRSGPGQVATPEQAQDAIAFVRALVGDRSREQAARTRILYGGQRQARQRRRAPGPARCRRRAGGRREPRRRVVRGDRRRGRRLGGVLRGDRRAVGAAGRARGADRARRLGSGRPRARQRGRPCRHARVRRAVVALSHDHADRVRQGGRPPRGADGQLRGRPSQPRRRQRRHAGPHPHRRRRRERRVRLPTKRCAMPSRPPSACT